jgi:hypothetical protein
VHFSQCILEDRDPEPAGEEGLADVRILEAIVESAAIGRRVTLSPFERSQRPSGGLEMRKPPAHLAELVHAPSPSK